VAPTAPNTIEQTTTRIADRIVTNIAPTLASVVRAVEQLAAGQEHLTREIVKLEDGGMAGTSE
jgi:hypothetical protein